MIAEKRMKVVGGSGGPNDDSIPVYASDKAPGGDWTYELDGVTQLKWENGKEVIIVNPELVSPEQSDDFFSLKPDGKISYCRAWLIGEDGHGVNPNGQAAWVEYSHLVPVSTAEPEPVPLPEPEGEWMLYDWRMENGRLWLKKA